MDTPVTRAALGPSLAGTWALSMAHVGAAALLAIPALPGWLRLAALLVLSVSLLWQAALHALVRHPASVIELEWGREAGRVDCRRKDGGAVQGTVLPTTYVSPGLTVLNLQEAASGARRSVLILPDRIDPDRYRRLRVWLRYRGLPSAARGPAE